MLKIKLLTIGASLLLISFMLIVWANASLFNLSQKKNHPKSNLVPYIKAAPTNSQDSSGEASILIQLSKQDATQRFGVSEQDLTVAEVTDTNFGDGSLGCPEPGKFYTQAIINGWVIKLKAGDKIYEYHTNKTNTVIFCQ